MSFQDQLVVLRNKIIDRLILVSLLFVGIALAASLSRAFEIGWQPIFTLHISIFVVLVILFLTKSKWTTIMKSHFLFVMYFAVVLAGLINFRTVGATFLIIMIISFTTLLYGLKPGILYSLLFIIAYSIIGWMHINQLIEVNVDFDQYVNNATTWISHLTAYAFALAVILILFDMHYKLFKGSLAKNYIKTIELQETNKQLEISKRRYESIFTGSNDGFLFVDKEYRIIKCNQSYLDMHGYKLEDVIGKDYKQLLPKADFNWDEFVLELSESNEPVEIETYHKDGYTFPLEVTVFKAEFDSEIHLWAALRDLREKKKLEQEVFSTMVKSEEKERERYAKELHDGLGPLLSTSMIYVNTIQNEKKPDLINEYAKRAHELLLETTNVVREISNNLSPLILKEYGIVHAIRSFIEKTQILTDIKFSIEDHIKGRFNETLEMTVYRTLVELTNNSIKYSKAKNIKYIFVFENEELSVHYEDDGVGFDYQEALNNNSGFGLMNLQTRIKKLRGYYMYDTSPGRGVDVCIAIKTNYI